MKYRDPNVGLSFNSSPFWARVELICKVVVLIAVMPFLLIWFAFKDGVFPWVAAFFSELVYVGYVWRELGKPVRPKKPPCSPT